MGRMKSLMIENENKENEDITSFLKELLAREEISGALAGITKQISSRGIKSMTGNQKATVEKFIKAYSQNNECEGCQNMNISQLTDLIYVSENGICPMCEYDRAQLMKD